MTNKEAIKILERLQEPEAWEPQISEDAYTALGMAIDAMKKEVPAKPTKSIDPYSNSLYKLYCPICKRWIGSGNSRVGTLNKFTAYSDRCDRCGQMILWEGEE